jgi:membrane protein YqaA with SNARE-associated domain
LVLGMPMLLTWLSGWAALSTIALIIHYCIDGKAAQTRKGA